MAKKINPRTPKPPMKETGVALLSVEAQHSLVQAPAASNDVVVRDTDATLVTGRHYLAGDRLIPALEIYFVDGSKPSGDHPWLGEADKVAWRDPATSYECIMLRNAAGGFLEGYVGVPRDHPLYGFDRHALPDGLGIAVHGGIGYAEICEDGPTPQRRTVREEARRICHVPSGPARYQPTEHATDYRVEDDHAWWFGFACNGPTDVVPIDPLHRHRDSAAAGGIRQTYRDDDYVCGEVLNLAAQLRAIQDGLPMPERTGPPLPPVGLAPKREG